jgi:hypothetical protein
MQSRRARQAHAQAAQGRTETQGRREGDGRGEEGREEEVGGRGWGDRKGSGMGGIPTPVRKASQVERLQPTGGEPFRSRF